MKLTVTSPDGRITAEIEGSTDVELFEKIARFHEVFGNSTCVVGDEASTAVRFVVREHDGNKYYEMRCDGPGELKGYKKEFGCNRTGGGLFPRSKDREGNWLPNNGWQKWSGNGGGGGGNSAPADSAEPVEQAPF